MKPTIKKSRQFFNQVYLLLISQFVSETPANLIHDECENHMVELSKEFVNNTMAGCPEIMAQMGPYLTPEGALTPYAQSLVMAKLNASNDQSGQKINFDKVFRDNKSTGFLLKAFFTISEELQKKYENGTIMALTAETKDGLRKVAETVEFLSSVTEESAVTEVI